MMDVTISYIKINTVLCLFSICIDLSLRFNLFISDVTNTDYHMSTFISTLTFIIYHIIEINNKKRYICVNYLTKWNVKIIIINNSTIIVIYLKLTMLSRFVFIIFVFSLNHLLYGSSCQEC